MRSSIHIPTPLFCLLILIYSTSTDAQEPAPEKITVQEKRVISSAQCPCVKPYLIRHRNGLFWNSESPNNKTTKKNQTHLKYMNGSQTPVSLSRVTELDIIKNYKSAELKENSQVHANNYIKSTHRLFEISDKPIKFSKIGLFFYNGKNPRVTEKLNQQNPQNITPKSVWLGPLQRREIRGCGTIDTYPLHLEENSSGQLPDAVWVEAINTNGTSYATLFDMKYLRLYGISRIPICHHGLTASNQFNIIKVTPFDVLQNHDLGTTTFIKNQLGDWLIDGKINQKVPDALQQRPSLINFNRGKSLTVLFFILFAASIFGGAWIWKIISKRRKLNNQKLECSNCQHQFELNVNNPKNDGSSCPNCSKIYFYFKEKAIGDTEIIQIDKQDVKSPKNGE